MILRADNLIKKYKQRTVVNDVSFSVSQGEIVGLLGPNGAGKTTSFYMIVGLIKPNEGSIYLGDEDITKDAMYRRAQKGIGYLAQEASVFRKLSVEDNILAILEMTDMTRVEREEKLEELIDEFSLHKVRRNRGDLLSGGERRRTEIARALAANPNFILLDEPFAGIDPVTVQEIQKIIEKLRDEDGLGVLITDHNVRETLGSCDRAYILTGGQIIAHGPPKQIAEDPKVKHVYLGENFRL